MTDLRAVLVWSDELLAYDFGEGHPLRSIRCALGVEEILSSDLREHIDIVEPRMATEEELMLFHTREHVEAVRDGRAGDLDTPVSKGLYDPARLSVGATLRALEKVIVEDYDVGINICGGWHHAFENRSRGFCIFNDIAVGVRYAQKLGVKRVMVIDWDVHHGDGTQRAFKGDEDVFTMSIHQHPSTQYPYASGYEEENDESNLNVPIMPGEGEHEILKRVLPIFPVKIRQFRPELLVIQMGADGHREDPMSSIDLGDRFYSSVSKTLGRCMRNNGFPVVLLGGGGFNFPKTAEIWRSVVENFLDPDRQT